MTNVTNATLLSRLPSLADCTAKAKGGTTTTAICSKLEKEYHNDDLVGWYLCILSGDNKGTDTLITSSDRNTGTLTFDALSSAIDATTQIAVTEDGYQNYIDEAWLVMQDDFRNSGLTIDLFLTTSQLREMHIVKTLELICNALFHDATSDDSYYARMQHYANRYGMIFTPLKADYDSNEDGVISYDEELQKKQARLIR